MARGGVSDGSLREGCKLGLERVARQKEVVAKTEKQFKRMLQATKEQAAAGDDALRDMRRRVKRQLKDMSRADVEGGGGGGGQHKLELVSTRSFFDMRAVSNSLKD